MRVSDEKAKSYLFQRGYRELYLKPHRDTRDPRNIDYIHNFEGSYAITDFYNLFDGFCFDRAGNFVWFQVKTNGWMEREKKDKLDRFMEDNHLTAIVLNVKTPTKKRRTYHVMTREYRS